MAIAKLYVVRDLVAGEAGPVFTAKNDGIAIRQTCQLLHGCIDVNDYALYQVGTIDTEEMEIQPEIKQISFEQLYSFYKDKLEELKARETFISEVK